MASIPLYLRLWLALVYLHAIAKGGGGRGLVLEFGTEPHDVVVSKGEPFTWDCRAGQTDGAAPNVTWRLNGEPVRLDSRKSILSNGSLYFKRVRKSRTDEGVYDCVLQDERGKIVSKPAHLYVADWVEETEDGLLSDGLEVTTGHYRGLSRSSGADEDISISQGDVLWMRCPVSATPSHAAPTYVWERDKTHLPLNQRYTNLPSGVLEIRGVQATDEGRYRCIASIAHEERKSRQIQLITTSGSGKQSKVEFWNVKRQTFTVNTGESIVLPCGASGLPQPTISWTHRRGQAQERVVVDDRKRRVGQGSLEIQRALLTDDGTYTCSGRNALTNPPVTSVITLRVLEAPRISGSMVEGISSQEHTIRYPVAHFASLICNASGNPVPNITWFHNAKRISIGGRYKIDGYKFIIDNSRATDSGYYQCIAENEAGIAQSTTFLEFYQNEKAAARPMNLQAVEIKSKSLKVKWESEEAIFSVHYRQANEPEKSDVVPEKEFVIGSLKPHTNYTIYVTAYATKGASDPSTEITVLTEDDVPIAAPEIRLTPLGGTSVKVEWDELPENKARGLITKYEVIYRKQNGLSETVEEVSGDARDFVITDLEPETIYEVRVRASTRAGYAKLDDTGWSTVTTPGSSVIK